MVPLPIRAARKKSMSTRIFDPYRQAARVAACLLICAGLAGCGGRGGGISLGPRPAPAPAEIAVTAEQIVITGPAGYCVDPTATRNSDDTGFVLLGNCAAIANSRRAGQPITPAVLTAAVSEPSDGGRLADSLLELDGFFRSDDGRRLLSRSGEAETVAVLDTLVDGDVFLLQATDSSDGAIEGVQNEYWRAYMDVGTRIATLSVIALEDSTLSREDSLTTLRGFVQAVQGANTGEPAVPVAQPAPVAPQPSRQPERSTPRNLPLDTGPLFNVGLFRRILG